MGYILIYQEVYSILYYLLIFKIGLYEDFFSILNNDDYYTAGSIIIMIFQFRKEFWDSNQSQ